MIYLLAFVIDIVFAVWASLGRQWYWYAINIIMLFVASGILNTSYIQFVTRVYSVFILHGSKGMKEAIGLALPTLIFWAVAYSIAYFVFRIHLPIFVFIGACFLLSTIFAFIDDQFRVAVGRTHQFDEEAKQFRDGTN